MVPLGADTVGVESFLSVSDTDKVPPPDNAYTEEYLRPMRPVLPLPPLEVPEPPKYTLNDVVFLESFGARIRDFEGYIGYHWGRNVQRAVEFGRDMINDAANGAIKGVKKVIAQKQEKSEQEKFKHPRKYHDHKHDSEKDFRYRKRK